MTETMLFSQLEQEHIARAFLLALYDGINDEIAVQNTAWSSRDNTFYSALGRTPPTIEAEEIDDPNFYPGHVPSLIDAPIENYPNIAVMSPNADPLQATDDHQDQYMVRIFVEIMVKAVSTLETPDPAADAVAAELVNARLMRTVQATMNVLRKDRSLGGIVSRYSNTPIVSNGDVFVRRQEKGRGPRWFWQGARLDYRLGQWVDLYTDQDSSP